MARTRWSVMITKWSDGTVIDRVPAGGMKFTDSLRNSGTVELTLPATVRAIAAAPEDDYWERALWPCRDGRPVGCYVFTGHKWASPSSMIGISGPRCDAVLWKRSIRQTAVFDDIDQNDILRDLIRLGISQPTYYANPQISQDFQSSSNVPWWRLHETKSGVLRDRLQTPGNDDDGYPGAARKNVGQMIKNLMELGSEAGTTTTPGPEYRLLYRFGDDGVPLVDWDIQYPAVGVSGSNAGRQLFEYPGGNITSIQEAGDGGDMARRVSFIGGDVNGAKAVGDAIGMSDGWGNYLDAVYTDQAQDQTTLNMKAAGRLEGQRRPQLGVNVTLSGDRRPEFGTYGLGDVAEYKRRIIGRGTITRDVRITGWSVQVDPTGNSETVTPTLEFV